MPSLSSPFVASPRPAGRGEAPNYTASLNLKVKVLELLVRWCYSDSGVVPRGLAL